jgi:AcrR family transcriptional regulator
MMDGLAQASPRPATAEARARILDAAERLTIARGVAGLTLEAAAREAGVSKGGLLYHFASKEALVTAMLARLAEHIEADWEQRLAAQPEGHPARAARAVLSWSFETPDEVCQQHEVAGAVFLATFHHDPALLDPIRAVFARIRERLRQDALPPGHGLAIMLASDGLFLSNLFGLYRPSPEEHAQLRAALEKLA